MATRPRNKRVDRGIIERGGVTPIRFLTGLVLDRMEKRDERKYMDSLKKMGMLDKGGGRANVPPKKKSKPKSPPSKNQVKRKKSPPKKMKPMKVYKTAKGGRIDGCAIKGKTRGTIR
jgi:hypothetical protein